MLHILKIDDAQRSGRIVGDVNVMSVYVGAVHAAGDGGGVFGENLEMRRIGGIEEDDAVLAVGRALAGEDANLFVRRGADVVDDAGVDLERVEQLGIGGIGNVVNEHFVGNGG